MKSQEEELKYLTPGEACHGHSEYALAWSINSLFAEPCAEVPRVGRLGSLSTNQYDSISVS